MSRLVAVAPPETPVFRVARGLDPTAPPDWTLAFEDGTFGNRFDDPRAVQGVPETERYRAIYCATQREAAFGETIARLRPSMDVLAELADIEDSEPFDLDLLGGEVSEDWRAKRRLGTLYLDPSLRFIDLDSSQTLQYLRRELAPQIRDLGLPDFDLSAVTGPHRKLTQEISRYIYEYEDESGGPVFAGIRYVSRLNIDWECWAIFDKRMGKSTTGMPESIFPDDPGLIEAANLFDLKIEIFPGQYSFLPHR